MARFINKSICVGVLGISVFAVSSAYALKTEGQPTAEDYKLCGKLAHNAHSLFTNPQSKMGVLVNSAKLFNRWIEISGVSVEEGRAVVKQISQKSFEEFDSKEKFNSTYSEAEQSYCRNLLEEVDKTN